MQFCPRYADVFFSLSPDFQSGHIILCPLAAVIHHPLSISSAFYAVIHRPLSRMPSGRPIWRPVRANSTSAKSSRVSVDVLFQDETVWLPIEQMSILFGKSRSTINEHILNIYKEGELSEADTVRKIGISDFSTKPTNFYNLDVGTQ